MSPIVGALLGGSVAAGGWLVQSGWSRRRRPRPWIRVVPYIRDVRPDLAEAPESSPLIARASAALDRMVGGRRSVERRLARLGSDAGVSSVEGFRALQLVWVAAGFAIATSLALVAWTFGRGSVVGLMGFCVFGAAGGAVLCDQELSVRVARRERRIRAELPVVADLLALAVAAGESPVAGLERVVRVVHGALGDELAAVLAEIRTGTAVTSAFGGLAARTGVPNVARFAEGLVVALERGTPLVDVLHAQAADVREAARRDLIETGGRREVAMMIPVVFLLLPVTIVFAFFPGYVGLHLS
ncbi:MAG TPA: type II secretion system F family protein [Aeromicrobium sp.]|nr:type II secretion system F family protein [Aeromicrobium sp.]HKY57048.1 type II secretion system F family protein [Aeromicrobium sp.]